MKRHHLPAALDMMNSSNAISDAVPERIDLRRAVNDARMEGPDDMAAPSSAKKASSGPVKELTAASTLTSMVKKGDPGDVEEEDEEDEFNIPQRFTKSGRKKATPFPMKLMKVLSQKKYSDIITWLPDGKSFTIIRPKTFVAEILPDHFKQAKYSSFTRKLHRWGFQRHLRGEEAGSFFHRLFQRGRLDLVEKMTCYKPSEVPQSKGVGKMGLTAAGLTGGMGGIGAGIGAVGGIAGLRDPMAARGFAGLGGFAGAGMNLQQSQAMQQLQLQQQLQQLQMQQQILQQQQEQVAQQHAANQLATEAQNLRSPALGPMGQSQGMGGGVGQTQDRLDAAIELEVSRRLKERIMGASLSRQALSMMPGAGSQGPVGSTTGGMFGNQAQMANMMGLNLFGQDMSSRTASEVSSSDANQSNTNMPPPRF